MIIYLKRELMFISPDFWLCFSFLYSISFCFSCLPRVPGPTSSTFSSVPPAPVPGPSTHPEPSTHSWATAAGDGTGRLSSDEGDVETAEDGDRPSIHCSNHHPQPLGVSIITKYDYYYFFFFYNPIQLLRAVCHQTEK